MGDPNPTDRERKNSKNIFCIKKDLAVEVEACAVQANHKEYQELYYFSALLIFLR
jgi:hypothetical protein